MKIDYDLLRKQRSHLTCLIFGDECRKVDVLEGILSLLDAIQDGELENTFKHEGIGLYNPKTGNYDGIPFSRIENEGATNA